MLQRKCFLALLAFSQLVSAQRATVTTESRDILTYPYNDPDPVPILAEGRTEIYPYHMFNGYSLTGQVQKWNVVKLENDYIEVYVMPSDGGKVWGAIEKSTGKEFIYRNEVMKYRNISMRGPWTSGGIEFNFGFIGHNPSTCVPVDYKTVENKDGSVSCIVGSLDLPSRTKWLVEVRLPKDKAYFETRAMWSNPTELPQSYYNWMTAAAVVTDDLQFMYPGNQEIGHGGEAGPWPVDQDGHDRSWYRNNAFGSDRSAHVVGEYNDFMGGYYHNSDFGFGHWALYDEMVGHKLWLWSQARSGAIWEDLLTDTDGQYMEFQAGRLFNQYSPSPSLKTPITQVPFIPGVTDRWREIWFPVRGIGGFVDVSPLGVLNVKQEGGKLTVGVNSLAFAQGKLVITSGGKVLFSESRSYKPMEVFQTAVSVGADAGYEVTVEGMDLRYNPDKRNLLARPFVTRISTATPTASSIYFEGMELKENRDYAGARKLLLECLQKDPLFIDALVAMEEICYRSNQLDSALYYADRALQLDTYHPGANYFAGVTYKAKGDLINALESLGWAARSTEYKSTAYALMAGIKLKAGEADLAEHYAALSLDNNRYNVNAMRVLAILYRASGRTALADANVETMIMADPLDHFADFERYLLHPADENLSRFSSTIRNEMPYQTYLELCLDYYDLGLKNEALQVLDHAPSHPLVLIWKAYLKEDPALLDEAARASAAYVFPYRIETLSALKWAVSKNSNWKFRYYLALNYRAIQREEDARKLLVACAQEPDYAPFYLARAALVYGSDKKSQLADLENARRLAPEEWRTSSWLIRYYEDNRNFPAALTVATEASKKFKGNPILGIQYAQALLDNGQYAACAKTLDGMNILPSEGSSIGKVVNEQTNLFIALDLIKGKKFGEALKRIDKSREWPERLGVGAPYDPDNRLQDYLAAYCLKKLNRNKEATDLQNKVVEYTTGNFSRPSLNSVLALWIHAQRGETGPAKDLMQKIGDSGKPGNPVRDWIMAMSGKDVAKASQIEQKMDGNHYLDIMKKIAAL